MNNAETFPVDVEVERDWLTAHKADARLSWKELGAKVGVPEGTLSTFGTGSYAGNNERVARSVFRYRQMLDSQAERSVGILAEPGYFVTPTSRRLHGLMVYAQMGRITVGATGPGTGKTMTMREYAASSSNVWIATMWESDKTLSAMITKVLGAIGDSPKFGRRADLSRQVADKIRGRRGLLVIDEANHLTSECLEEIRGWHDVEGGPGVCLLGNEELLMRIESGAKQHAYGRLNSRIAQRLIQNLPEEGDVEAFCDAWGLPDPGMRTLLARIAMTPGTGGLRECRQIVEQASMLAADDNRPLTIADLKDAQSTRATRHIRTS